MRRAGSPPRIADANRRPRRPRPRRRPRRTLLRRVAARIAAEPRITVHREEVTTLARTTPDTITILASGPLTQPRAAELQRLTGSEHLAFYDSISPIVDATTIDMDKVYFAARWDKGTADYINCPFTKEEYDDLPRRPHHRRTLKRKLGKIPRGSQQAPVLRRLPPHRRDRPPRPRHAPLRPHEARRPHDPKTGRWPYAVVQLRQENLRADSYNLVGFQNHLKYGEQARVLRLIPGLERDLPALRPDPPQHLHPRTRLLTKRFNSRLILAS
jgi:methylenetetrahydrofolate--tRNA-(uracil-5-)-methyltransferase